MSSAPSGLAGTLTDKAGPIRAPESMFPPVDQLDLLASGFGAPNGLDQLTTLRRRHERGRPPGARNKRNQKLSDYMISRYGDPLSVMGEIYSMPLDALMRLMIALQGGDAKHKPLRAVDAIRLKLEAAAQAAPYVHGKQPISVEVSRRKDGILVFEGMVDGGDVSSEEMTSLIEEFGMAALEESGGKLRLLKRDELVDAEFDEVEQDPTE